MYVINANLSGDQVRGCLDKTSLRPSLGLWSPEREITFEEALKLFRQYFPNYPMLPLDEASDMDVSSFYEAAKGYGVCIQTPASLWPEQ
jgi:hypothetical protein